MLRTSLLCVSVAFALGCESPPSGVDAGVLADAASHDAGRAAAQTISVVLGDSERGTSDGVGEAARFQGVTAMCALGPDRVVLSDTFSGTLRELNLTTREVRTLAGRANEPGVVDGSLAEARFAGPRGLGCYPSGNALLVADNGALRYVDLTTGQVTTVAGRSGAAGYEDGSAVRARFGYLIHAIQITPDGQTAVFSDRSNDAIRAIDLESYEVRTVSGPMAGWDGPGGLAFDPAQASPTEVVVADTFAGRLRAVELTTGNLRELGRVSSPQGVVLHEGAAISAGFESVVTRTLLATGESTPLTMMFGGTFSSPLVSNGALIYAELARGSIRRLALETLEDTSIAGSLSPNGSADGDARTARFEFIADVAASGDMRLVFLADAGNNAVRRALFLADGSVDVQTLSIPTLDTPAALALSSDARQLAVADYETGTVLELALNEAGQVLGQRIRATGLEGPRGLAWGPEGALFVAEQDGRRIRRIDVSDEVSVHAGTGRMGAGDGPALEATFGEPVGLVASDEGLLILDASGALRWSDFAAGSVTTLSAGQAEREPSDGPLAEATWSLPMRAVTVDGGWLVVDRGAGTLRLVTRGEAGQVQTLVGSAQREGGLAAGAVVPLDQAALGGASSLVRIDGGWLVATDTALHRIEGDAFLAR
jgi:DNA-binding beta-propeller fold protein YncE